MNLNEIVNGVTVIEQDTVTVYKLPPGTILLAGPLVLEPGAKPVVVIGSATDGR